MTKSFIQKIYSRIGFWIQYERKRRLKCKGDLNCNIEKFILLHEGEKFLDFIPNESICSRSTLSRIEKGKVISATQLIKFILKRFGKKYRIIELDQYLIDSTINTFYTYIFCNNNISTNYLKKILKDTNSKVVDNFLWNEDYLILNRILEWIENFKLIQKNEFDDYYQKFMFYHKSIQDILIFYMVFSVYFNPELWIYNQLVTQLIQEEYATNELLSVFEDLFNNRPHNVFRTFYRNKQLFSESGFLKETIIPLKCMFDYHHQYSHKVYHNLMYMSLVHKLNVKDYSDDSLFETCIFSFLRHHYSEDIHDINRLLYLIKDEPYPRIINELVLKQVYLKIKSKSHLQKILSFLLN